MEPAAAGSSAGTTGAEAAGFDGGADVDGADGGAQEGWAERDDVMPTAAGRRSFFGAFFTAASTTDVPDRDSGSWTEIAMTWVPVSTSSTMAMPAIHTVEGPWVERGAGSQRTPDTVEHGR